MRSLLCDHAGFMIAGGQGREPQEAAAWEFLYDEVFVLSLFMYLFQNLRAKTQDAKMPMTGNNN